MPVLEVTQEVISADIRYVQELRKAPHPDMIIKKPKKKVDKIFGIKTSDGQELLYCFVTSGGRREQRVAPPIKRSFYYNDTIEGMFGKW